MIRKLLNWKQLILGAGIFLALFAGTNVVGEQFFPRFDANHWWIIIPTVEGWPATAVMFLFAVLTIAFAVKPRIGKVRRFATIVTLGGCGLVALWNAVQFAVLVLSGTISAGFVFPLSLGIALVMFCLTALAWRSSSARAECHWIPLSAGFITCALLFPLLQMICFGKTDYRRTADAAVVFGARTYANGALSDALADRVRTACDLYRQGLVQKLIMSGGPGDGEIHETEAMRHYAIRCGVRETDILLDPRGLNTSATVNNTTALFRQHSIRRVLAVSHFYHLPRVKMAYQRAGWEVYTVPAQTDQVLAALPLFMAREIAALGKYYFAVPNT